MTNTNVGIAATRKNTAANGPTQRMVSKFAADTSPRNTSAKAVATRPPTYPTPQPKPEIQPSDFAGPSPGRKLAIKLSPMA